MLFIGIEKNTNMILETFNYYVYDIESCQDHCCEIFSLNTLLERGLEPASRFLNRSIVRHRIQFE